MICLSSPPVDILLSLRSMNTPDSLVLILKPLGADSPLVVALPPLLTLKLAAAVLLTTLLPSLNACSDDSPDPIVWNVPSLLT